VTQAKTIGELKRELALGVTRLRENYEYSKWKCIREAIWCIKPLVWLAFLLLEFVAWCSGVGLRRRWWV